MTHSLLFTAASNSIEEGSEEKQFKSQTKTFLTFVKLFREDLGVCTLGSVRPGRVMR